jgi:predicted Zn-dependent peptidase
MYRLGRSELLLGEVPSLDAIVADVEAVTAADVERVVDRVLRDNPVSVAAVGPVTVADLTSRSSSV